MKKTKRPLLKGKSDQELVTFIENKIKERSPYYLNADIVHHQHKSDDDVVGEILSHLSQIMEE